MNPLPQPMCTSFKIDVVRWSFQRVSSFHVYETSIFLENTETRFPALWEKFPATQKQAIHQYLYLSLKSLTVDVVWGKFRCPKG
eukprot:c34123_g1_i1 orf=185-436(-)